MIKFFKHQRRQIGFTLVEVMIAVVVVSILAAITYPNYKQYIVKSRRQAAMTQLSQLANLQEKIFLNSNAYATSVTSAYNGTSTGGLGKTSGTTDDNNYTLSIDSASPYQTYTLTAAPVAGSSQASDGSISIASDGARTWGSTSW